MHTQSTVLLYMSLVQYGLGILMKLRQNQEELLVERPFIESTATSFVVEWNEQAASDLWLMPDIWEHCLLTSTLRGAGHY